MARDGLAIARGWACGRVGGKEGWTCEGGRRQHPARMKVTYYGHSCFGVEVAGRHLLFDPFISPNEKASGVRMEDVAADYVLLSHGHFDHVADVAAVALRTGAMVVGCYEVIEWVKKQGVSAERVHAMNAGGAFGFEFGRVKFVSAIHSSTLPDGSPGGCPGGFVVESAREEEGSFYYSGDTALTLDMQLIGEANRLRFAALCIGDNFTMGIADAVRAAGLVRCGRVLGVHYDTWPILEIDHAAAKAAFHAAGCELHLPPIGGTLEL